MPQAAILGPHTKPRMVAESSWFRKEKLNKRVQLVDKLLPLGRQVTCLNSGSSGGVLPRPSGVLLLGYVRVAAILERGQNISTYLQKHIAFPAETAPICCKKTKQKKKKPNRSNKQKIKTPNEIISKKQDATFFVFFFKFSVHTENKKRSYSIRKTGTEKKSKCK